MSAALALREERLIRRVVDSLRAEERRALAALAFGPGNEVGRWAEIVWYDPKNADGHALLRLGHDDGDADPRREVMIDDAALARGLRRAIGSAVEISGIEIERAIGGHLAIVRPELVERGAPIEGAALASRIVQFACFESDTEVYYTGAGVES